MGLSGAVRGVPHSYCEKHFALVLNALNQRQNLLYSQKACDWLRVIGEKPNFPVTNVDTLKSLDLTWKPLKTFGVCLIGYFPVAQIIARKIYDRRPSKTTSKKKDKGCSHIIAGVKKRDSAFDLLAISMLDATS